MTLLVEELLAEAQKHENSSSEHKSFENVAKMVSAVAASVGSSTPLPRSFVPAETLDDGNRCPSDEEEYPKTGGTCFKKCSDLTGGAYPVRSSAFSCCKAEPCSMGNSKIHLSFCGGFDVAGDAEGNGCPSGEGACLNDEEMFDGICYKKCSLFSDGARFNHRVAPNICCSSKGFRCLLPHFVKFSADFAVGGGNGDGNSATPASPHAPIKSLTETIV